MQQWWHADGGLKPPYWWKPRGRGGFLLKILLKVDSSALSLSPRLGSAVWLWSPCDSAYGSAHFCFHPQKHLLFQCNPAHRRRKKKGRKGNKERGEETPNNQTNTEGTLLAVFFVCFVSHPHTSPSLISLFFTCYNCCFFLSVLSLESFTIFELVLFKEHYVPISQRHISAFKCRSKIYFICFFLNTISAWMN